LTAGRHDSAKDPTRISQRKEKIPKNILVRITTIWQNKSNKKDFEKKCKIISQLSPRNFNMANICISY